MILCSFLTALGILLAVGLTLTVYACLVVGSRSERPPDVSARHSPPRR